ERWEQTGKTLAADSADATQATAGSTGTKTATPSGSNTGWISQLVALKPAANGNNGIAVRYWVVGVDRDMAGNSREGSASNTVDAYASNLSPLPILGSVTCTTNANGSSALSWTQ